MLLGNMSAVLLLTKSLRRLQPRAAGLVFACCYHTERGVYGYQPKQLGGTQRSRVAALNQDHALARLVEAYRVHGHKAAKINPLLPHQPVLDYVPEIDMLAGAVKGTLDTSAHISLSFHKFTPSFAGTAGTLLIMCASDFNLFVSLLITNNIKDITFPTVPVVKRSM